MKTVLGSHARALVAGFVLGSMMFGGTAFAAFGAPEIDPGMATGGLTILGVGFILLMEYRRAQQ